MYLLKKEIIALKKVLRDFGLEKIIKLTVRRQGDFSETQMISTHLSKGRKRTDWRFLGGCDRLI